MPAGAPCRQGTQPRGQLLLMGRRGSHGLQRGVRWGRRGPPGQAAPSGETPCVRTSSPVSVWAGTLEMMPGFVLFSQVTRRIPEKRVYSAGLKGAEDGSFHGALVAALAHSGMEGGAVWPAPARGWGMPGVGGLLWLLLPPRESVSAGIRASFIH